MSHLYPKRMDLPIWMPATVYWHYFTLPFSKKLQSLHLCLTQTHTNIIMSAVYILYITANIWLALKKMIQTSTLKALKPYYARIANTYKMWTRGMLHTYMLRANFRWYLESEIMHGRLEMCSLWIILLITDTLVGLASEESYCLSDFPIAHNHQILKIGWVANSIEYIPSLLNTKNPV